MTALTTSSAETGPDAGPAHSMRHDCVNAVKWPVSAVRESILSCTGQHQVTARQAWPLLLRSLPDRLLRVEAGQGTARRGRHPPVSRLMDLVSWMIN